ncbi:hypothetical protein NKH18_20625 [Streptomyces sp. M10(2022)]
MLRVTFVAMTLLSCGLLAWASTLRLAIVTRERRDWSVFALVLVLNLGFFVFMGYLPEDPELVTPAQTTVAVIWLLAVPLGASVYYLIADINHFGPNGPSVARASAARLLSRHPPSTTGTRRRRPGPPHPPCRPRSWLPARRTADRHRAQRRTGSRPRLAPAPTPKPQRLDQVRAELDELSDYLRKEGGSQ